MASLTLRYLVKGMSQGKQTENEQHNLLEKSGLLYFSKLITHSLPLCFPYSLKQYESSKTMTLNHSAVQGHKGSVLHEMAGFVPFLQWSHIYMASPLKTFFCFCLPLYSDL